ncbi:zinc-binding alcohol dehydrogenase family protein [Streptomyces caatingaensis]|uniref:zinc-binding alcohol dehydrogenase family protein n=1 Tax=Streptomyces caatingaensis TaxID=1678637 RepID=UPI0006727420|nr:zinc-binding alcohol dehydrogenase family protein [Streptomyces caatingaensis]
MADGLHYAPAVLPHVAGLDGVGRLEDGTRVAFFAPRAPYGGMAEEVLVRRGMWIPVPGGADDVTAAALLNPGVTAWKAVAWEGRLTAGQSVLVLGATGASGRVAALLAARRGARVVAAGRNRPVLERLVEASGVHATIWLGLPPDELADVIGSLGPFDLIVDYLWGPPAEAVFAALARDDRPSGRPPGLVRHLLVGMTAGEVARVPAAALRKAPVQVVGSGTGGRAPLADVAAAFGELLDDAARGELMLDVDAVPLADVEKVWGRGDDARRVVFVP